MINVLFLYHSYFTGDGLIFLGRKKVKKPVEYEVYGGYYIALDGHHRKHTAKVELTRKALQNWGENNNDAIFNEKFRDNYKDALGKVIRIWADNGARSNYVCLEEDVGVDEGTSKQGEWTSVVELYYGGKEGSHMCILAQCR